MSTNIDTDNIVKLWSKYWVLFRRDISYGHKETQVISIHIIQSSNKIIALTWSLARSKFIILCYHIVYTWYELMSILKNYIWCSTRRINPCTSRLDEEMAHLIFTNSKFNYFSWDLWKLMEMPNRKWLRALLYCSQIMNLAVIDIKFWFFFLFWFFKFHHLINNLIGSGFSRNS